MHDITIAPARTDAEATAYLETQRKIRPEAPTLEEFRHREQAWTGAVHLLAYLDGEPADTAFAGSFPGTETEPHVGFGVGVVPELRRRGVGLALYHEAAKARGHRRLLTESQHENEPMRRLNEKLGFRPAPSMSTVVLRGPLAPD